MPCLKAETRSIRTIIEIKRPLRLLTKRERGFVASMVEVVTLKYTNPHFSKTAITQPTSSAIDDRIVALHSWSNLVLFDIPNGRIAANARVVG